MNSSNRFDVNSLFILGAFFLACGPTQISMGVVATAAVPIGRNP